MFEASENGVSKNCLLQRVTVNWSVLPYTTDVTRRIF